MYKRIIVILFLIAAGCKKNEITAPENIINRVNIRIENLTNYSLDSANLLYDTSNYNFGAIDSGKITPYHFLENIPDFADARVIINNVKIIAGLIVPPNSYPTPYLENGNYTLQIFADTIAYYGYNARFIKN